MLPIPIRLIETAPPGAEPVTLSDARAQLRERRDDDDVVIRALIAAARTAAEDHTGRALITRGYSLFLDAWPEGGIVTLPRPPLSAVTRINIHGAEGDVAEFPAAAYCVDAVSASARIALKTGAAAPCSFRAVNGIEIQYRAGYGLAPAAVPEALRQGILRMVAHLYQYRGDDEAAVSLLRASGAAALLQPYRVAGV